MTSEQSSGVAFEDISCLRPYADKINQYMSTRPSRKVRVCRKQFLDFSDWALEIERQAERDGNPRTVLKMPIDPADLAAYVGRLSSRGLKVSTIRTYLASIRMLHVAANVFNPTDSDVVKAAVAELADKPSDAVTSMRALSDAELDSVLAALPARRRARGNNFESVEGARKRAGVDRALLLTMIGTGMWAPEAADLTWGRVRKMQEGSVLVYILTDWKWVEGVWVPMDQECSEALIGIMPKGVDRNSSVFNLSRAQINRRLKRMSEEAGIDSTDISGYTPRATLVRFLSEELYAADSLEDLLPPEVRERLSDIPNERRLMTVHYIRRYYRFGLIQRLRLAKSREQVPPARSA